jgi:hypothetical protein
MTINAVEQALYLSTSLAPIMDRVESDLQPESQTDSDRAIEHHVETALFEEHIVSFFVVDVRCGPFVPTREDLPALSCKRTSSGIADDTSVSDARS